MAAQTLTDVTRNYDDAAISGLLNGEAITLNNSTLNINSDVRWAQQAAVFGSLTISASAGGRINVDATQTKWIRFDAATGNVPALGTAGVDDVTGSIAGVGEFLGVWTALGTAPLAAGTAMPGSGFIKLRKSTVSFVDNEVMTFAGGATATIDGEPQVGWIHIVGAELGTVTVPRLGEFVSRGDWFYLGQTNGADDQTFQYPVADCCPAIQVETSPGSGVYEWWLNAGSRWGNATQFVSTDERGKYFGMVNSTGVISIARRSAQPCGYKPVSGLRVRIPNIICSSSTASNWALNTINATATTRYDFTTTAAGAIDIEFLSSNWYLSFTNPYSVSIKHTGQLHFFLISNTASTTVMDNVGVGLDLALDSTPLPFTNLFSGATLSNIRSARYQSVSSGSANFSFADCANIILDNCVAETFGAAATTERGVALTYGFLLSRTINTQLNNCSSVCGNLALATTSNIQVSNYKYAERLNGTTSTTFPVYAITFSASCVNTYVDGFGWMFPSIANLHPYTGIVNLNNCNDTTIMNIGTAASPLNLGSANATGIFLNGTVALGLTMRRIYLDNTRTNLFTLANTVQNVICDNVWGDGLDAQALPALNMLTRGVRLTPSVTGQTACYGLHWIEGFQTTTRGQFTIAANEPLPATTAQAVITAGTPKYNSSGGIQMPTVGDQVVWEMPYFAVGHTKLGGYQFTDVHGTLMQNMDYEYQIDTGSGFSAWKFLMTTRIRSSGGTAGGNTFVFTSTASGRAPQIGDYVGTVLGTHFSPGTTVTNVVGTTITLSANILVTLPGSLQIYFWRDIEDEPSINPATGVKLKVRATTVVANAQNAITFIRIASTTNSTDQQIQYPLPVVLNEAKVAGIIPNSRIRVYNVTTDTEIANEVVASTEWELLYPEGGEFSTGDVIEIRLANVDGTNAYLPYIVNTIASGSGWSALASQQLDEVYNQNAIDGSTVTELTGDYPNVQIDSNDVGGETTVQRIYAWFAYNQSTSDGISNFFNAILAEDEVNYRIRTNVVNVKLDNTISTPLMIIGGRIYADDGTTVIAATSNSIQIDPNKAYGIEIGTSGLTLSEAATLNKLNTLTEDVSGLRFTAKALEEAPTGSGGGGTAPTAEENALAVRAELATELSRIDVAVSTRESEANAATRASTNQGEHDATQTAVSKTLTTAKFLGLK